MPKRKFNNTKQHIQECAIQLFKEHGYDNVTIIQICEAAGITKRTFYYHFASKNEIMQHYSTYLAEKAENIVDALVDQKSYVEILWVLLNTFSIYRDDGVDILRQIYLYVLQGKNEKEADFPYSTYLYETFARTIANAQKAGEIRNSSDPADLAFALQHLFRGVLFSWAAANGSFDLSERFRNVFDTLLGVVDTTASSPAAES